VTRDTFRRLGHVVIASQCSACDALLGTGDQPGCHEPSLEWDFAVLEDGSDVEPKVAEPVPAFVIPAILVE